MHSLLIDGAGENVLLVALADYMAKTEIAKIDLLKLDIEGSELNALKDLGDRIADVDFIVGEVNETLVDQAEFYNYLTSRGFRILWKRSFQESGKQHVHGLEALARLRPLSPCDQARDSRSAHRSTKTIANRE